MPANLSEGVFGKDVAIAVVYVVEMREGERRRGWFVILQSSCWLMLWRGAAFAVAEGARKQAKMEGATLAHSATFT